MADQEDAEDELNSKKPVNRDLVTIGLLLCCAASIGGFAVLLSMVTTDVTEPESLLCLASREFVERPIVAGKLAELAAPADSPIEPLEMPLDTSDEDCAANARGSVDSS